MSRFFSRVFALLLIAVMVAIACTFKIEPVVEVNDASVNIGPIYICVDAGG